MIHLCSSASVGPILFEGSFSSNPESLNIKEYKYMRIYLREGHIGKDEDPAES